MDNVIGRAATPVWFWLVSGLALLWNLMGVGAYINDVSMSPDELVTAYGQTMTDAMAIQPAWVTGAYALAVFSGALGCLLLLLRKKIAIWPLLLSLLCVVGQQIYGRFMSGVMGEVADLSKIMYVIIPIIAVFLVWFARKMTAKRIIT